MDFFGGSREEIFISKEQSILLGGVKVPQRWSPEMDPLHNVDSLLF